MFQICRLFLASEALQVLANGVIVDLRPRSDPFIRFPLLLFPGKGSAAFPVRLRSIDWRIARETVGLRPVARLARHLVTEVVSGGFSVICGV